MFRKISVLTLAVLLSSCAYTTEGSIQDLTIRTPGAENAVCDVYVNGLRYKFHAPQTRSIYKSDKNLEIDCSAPGNRRKQVYIEPAISRATSWNIVNGGIPGVAWDHASGAMYEYPSVVEIDFTDAKIKPPAPPAQNKPDIRQPEDYDLEEFAPSVPRLNSDRYRESITPQKRQPYDGFVQPEAAASQNAGSGIYGSGGTIPPTSNEYASPGSKGDLMSVIQRTGAQVDTTGNAQVAPSGDVQNAISGQVEGDNSGADSNAGSDSSSAPIVISPYPAK